LRYLTSISLALIVHVLLSIGMLMALACAATPAEPTPNILATVEARLAEEKNARPPTPTPFEHHPLLSHEQVKKILEQYISNPVKREQLGSRAIYCLYWDNSGYSGLNRRLNNTGGFYGTSIIEWRYMDDNSDRWIVTSVGDQCDGIQKWHIDDDTGKLLQEPAFPEHQLATPAP
jgi:hypothetical protein